MTVLTSKNTVQEWLDDAVGGPLLRGILAQGGRSADDLRPAAGLSLRTLVELGGGRFPQELVDTLVRQANNGVLPPEESDEPAKAASDRFSGRTVVVTGAGSGIGQLDSIAVDADGNLYVGLHSRPEILVHDTDGALLRTISVPEDDAPGLGSATNIAIEPGTTNAYATISGPDGGFVYRFDALADGVPQ